MYPMRWLKPFILENIAQSNNVLDCPSIYNEWNYSKCKQKDPKMQYVQGINSISNNEVDT